MTRCKRCLYPTTKPDLYFDDEGICSACRAYEKREKIDWNERRNELVKILEQAPKNDSGFDCIVPSSGGKDSTYQAITLKELGARPLCVTATTCHLTDIGRKNIDNLARHCATVEITPNMSVRARLNKLGLTLVGDISWPEHLAIFTIPFQAAKAFGIPLMFYGECPQNQYGGPPGTDAAKYMTDRWLHEFGGLNGLRPSDMVGQLGITEADMLEYRMPDTTGIQAYFLGQYIPWDSHRNAEMAKAHGFTAQLPNRGNWWDFENLDNAQTGIHDWFMWLKYGFGRASAQLSVDIRKHMIERETALTIASVRDGWFPNRYMGVPLDEMMRRIDVSEAEFEAAVERFRNAEAPNYPDDPLSGRTSVQGQTIPVMESSWAGHAGRKGL